MLDLVHLYQALLRQLIDGITFRSRGSAFLSIDMSKAKAETRYQLSKEKAERYLGQRGIEAQQRKVNPVCIDENIRRAGSAIRVLVHRFKKKQA